MFIQPCVCCTIILSVLYINIIGSRHSCKYREERIKTLNGHVDWDGPVLRFRSQTSTASHCDSYSLAYYQTPQTIEFAPVDARVDADSDRWMRTKKRTMNTLALAVETNINEKPRLVL